MLRTILIDDERIMLRRLEKEFSKYGEIDIVGTFSLSIKALEYAKENPVDFAVMDIEMPSMNGIELGKQLRLIYPNIIIVYATGYDHYLKEAFFDVKSDYYLLKPYSTIEIDEAVQRAILLSERLKHKLYAHTFGRFDLFEGDNSINFVNSKAKELLALCIDHRGGEVTMEECIDKLWGDRPYDDKVKNLYRKAVGYLNKLFQEINYRNVFINERGKCFINPKELDSDYFKLLDHDPKAIDTYHGEYMIQYEWARDTEIDLNKELHIDTYEND